MTRRSDVQSGEGVWTDQDPAGERWIETKPGYLFFVNALLVAPPAMVLVPLALRWILRAAGLHEGPSRFLDPLPLVAEHVLPYLGWLLILPMVLLVWNLRIERRTAPRLAILVFLLVHAGFLTWTALWWLSGSDRLGGVL